MQVKSATFFRFISNYLLHVSQEVYSGHIKKETGVLYIMPNVKHMKNYDKYLNASLKNIKNCNKIAKQNSQQSMIWNKEIQVSGFILWMAYHTQINVYKAFLKTNLHLFVKYVIQNK